LQEHESHWIILSDSAAPCCVAHSKVDARRPISTSSAENFPAVCVTDMSDARDVSDTADLAAGDFSVWIEQMGAAIAGERAADVACDGCTACCTAAQFIHIAPDETDTLAHVPAALLFPAPQLPKGHVVMGYDDRGHCPMLIEGRCSIYEHRPRTCRTYDCRIFAACGIEPDADKVEIAARVKRWQFSYPTTNDSTLHDAVVAAADFVANNRDATRGGRAPVTAAAIAVAAVRIVLSSRTTSD
jgi:Fe-S-cluster containining protein